MRAANPASGAPSVSIIVPARNEAAALGACLESLVTQTGVDFEITLVDDGSTDRTRQIAESFPSIRVMQPGPLPAGWTGKNYAVTAGAKTARGEWLLFTDADTVHLPGSLARSLAEAKEKNADLLSYSPEQQAHSFWEKAVMPVIFAELASTFKPKQVSDPASPAAAANGQYILVKRSAYEAVGGHAAVANDLLEDVALARKVKYSGRKILFRYGGDAVRTRMYRNFAQLNEGWTKNLALLFPSPIRLAILRIIEFLLMIGSLGVGIFELSKGRSQVALVLAMVFCVVMARFGARIQKAHFPRTAYALAEFGLPVFAYLLFRSRRFHRQGKVPWKGRTYLGENRVVTAASAVTPSATGRNPATS